MPPPPPRVPTQESTTSSLGRLRDPSGCKPRCDPNSVTLSRNESPDIISEMTTKRVRETQTERDNKGTALTELAQKQTMGLKSSLDQRNDTNAIQHDCNIRELAPMELSDEAQLNIVCNRYVGNTVAAWSQNQNQSMPQLLEPPYEGSKALLRTGKLWITSYDSKRLHFARRAPIIRQYCMK
jgi:hypothetical protein